MSDESTDNKKTLPVPTTYWSINANYQTRCKSSGAVSIDPISVISILAEVIIVLVRCWNFHNQFNSAAEVSSKALADLYYSNQRPQLLNSVAKQILRKSKDPINRTDALLLANSIISEALDKPEDFHNALRDGGFPSAKEISQFPTLLEDQV